MEPALRDLLLLMAALKTLTALGAALLTGWRFKADIERSYARAYLAAGAFMTTGAVAMWHPSHILVAGALFHIGLVTFLLAAYRDRGASPEPWRGVLGRRASW